MSTLNINLGGLPTNPGAPAAAEPAAPLRTAKPADKKGWWWGTGRRKTAVARARIKPGDGSVIIETPGGKKKTVEEFFAELRDRNETLLPLRTTDTFGKMQVVVKVHGGGFMGQAGAAKLAIARALVDYDPNFYVPLRQGGMLTRDAREVERKKYGQAGARRRFQFSKR